MTNEEIIKFQKRARYVATKRGHAELADDFAQDLILIFIKSPDRRSTVDQLFTDYLRGTYGDTRSALGRARSFAVRESVSLDDARDESEKSFSLYERIAAPESDTEAERSCRECSHLFGGRKAEIYEAYFVEEKTEKVIAQGMELTESRICQLLKPMKREIQDYYILREGLERIEWDPDYTKLQVDWIKL